MRNFENSIVVIFEFFESPNIKSFVILMFFVCFEPINAKTSKSSFFAKTQKSNFRTYGFGFKG